MMSYSMSVADREAFLAAVHVGVLSVCQPDRGPLSVPVWYAYEPGGAITVWSGEDARKAQLIRAAGRFSLCAQQETQPYQYVSVEGPVVRTESADIERHIRPLAERYLGVEAADNFLNGIGGPNGVTDDIVITMQPQYWATASLPVYD
jgi:hypothetical protein